MTKRYSLEQLILACMITFFFTYLFRKDFNRLSDQAEVFWEASLAPHATWLLVTMGIGAFCLMGGVTLKVLVIEPWQVRRHRRKLENARAERVVRQLALSRPLIAEIESAMECLWLMIEHEQYLNSVIEWWGT